MSTNVARRVWLIFLFAAIGCRDDGGQTVHRYSRFAMGTFVDYAIVADSDSRARRVVNEAHSEIERVADLLWEEDSLSATHALNRSRDSVLVEPEALSFLSRSKEYWNQTESVFDITIKPVAALYDFGAEHPVPPSADAIANGLAFVGWNNLVFRSGGWVLKAVPQAAVAVGGVAKGYAVDRAIEIIRGHGIAGAVVNAGGDLYCLGSPGDRPWTVGVRDPDDPAAILHVLNVQNAAVATSGDYQQYFEYKGARYHHIINPVTGRPAEGTRSATVIAPTTEQADALATALFILGSKRGIQLLESIPDVDGLLVDAAGQTHQTSGMVRYLERAGPQVSP